MNKIVFPEIDLGGVKGVFVDIDNTLYPYEPAHQKAITACYDELIRAFGIKLSFDDFYQTYRRKRTEATKRLSPQGACRSRLFAFQSFFEEKHIPQAFSHALKFETLYWDTLINNMVLCEDASRFLLLCKERNIPVCALSDMQTHFQIQKLHTLKVDHLIDYLVTSEEVGAEKPAPVMFETALKKLKLRTDEVIMIGDSKEKDIIGAQNLGIKSYLVEVMNG